MVNILLLVLVVSSFCASDRVITESRPDPVPNENGRGLLVTYIANEGVLVSSGDKQVLIDGLHREYKPAYAFPPPDLLRSLESAASPYSKIDLILVTHIHGDHFHPLSVGLHLQNNPKARLVSSEQIAEGVKKEFGGFSTIESRIERVAHEWKRKVALNVSGINLKGLGLKHSGANFSWIQNLGYVVELNGAKILHIGDADMTEENFSSLGLVEEKIDVAFIPYWFLLSNTGRAIVQNHIRPKQVIAVHISPAEAAQVAEQVKLAYPGALTFTKILETTPVPFNIFHPPFTIPS
ncbi:MAG TPA: MBL fold metallo-hydrolase [Pyrinomonadaceae bacterium]|nr:MBL fold metallo-hydrolase [Pyrinomonadaceae bacterium]